MSNRTSVTNGGTVDYNSNSLNQYTSVNDVNYEYDENGNLTNDGTYKYYYDCENRLTEVTNLSIVYTYDPQGRRISKEIGSEITYYIYDGDRVICEFDGAGKLRRKFLYGTGIDEVVRMSHVYKKADITGDGNVNIEDLRAMAAVWLDEGTNTADLNYDEKVNNTDSDILAANWLINSADPSEGYYYYHFDGLGSVIALTDSAGKIVETYEYKVYGYTMIREASGEPRAVSKFANPYMFTGRRIDRETGMYYYRARFYNPYIGRFLQTDPIGYEDNMNLYLYAGNNPVVLVDTYGLCKESSNVFSRAWGWWDQTVRSTGPLATIGAVTIGALERVYDIECAAGRFFQHPRKSLGEATVNTLENIYDFEVAAYNQLYDLGYRGTSSNMYRTWYDIGRDPASHAKYVGNIISQSDLMSPDDYTRGHAWGGLIVDMQIMAIAYKASSWNVKMGIHGPHHGQGYHFQVNWWKTGVKGSGGRVSVP